jgi:flagellar assembly protein FliH
MMPFEKYEFRELTPEAPQKEPEFAKAEFYQEPNFRTQRDVNEIGKILKKESHFQLDRHVASQLGLEEKARKEAEEKIEREIQRRWEQNSERAEVAGYAKGLEEGKQEAFKAELPRIQEKVAKLEHLFEEMNSFRQKIFSANESFLMDLIARVAGMVALKEVSVDPDYIRRLVISLMHQIGTKDDTKIYLSPEDFKNVDALYQSLQKEFGKLSNTTVEASDSIPVGGCKIETRFGVVDASISTQIENVMKALKG